MSLTTLPTNPINQKGGGGGAAAAIDVPDNKIRREYAGNEQGRSVR